MVKVTSKSSISKGKYFFIILVISIFVFAISYINNGKKNNYKKESNSVEKNYTPANYSTNNNASSKKPKDYCSLSRSETNNYITKNSPFTLGSSGRVSFSSNSQITLSGSGKTLYGTWNVSMGNVIRINNLKVVSGSFDASNNYGVSGSLSIDCNGDISGNLYDRNGNSTPLNLKK